MVYAVRNIGGADGRISMARAAKEAAKVLLAHAGVEVGGLPASSPRKRGPIRRGGAV
jgi:hypothetical protein